MAETDPPQHSFRDALFLDIPYIIDSVCRHADYALNRRHRFVVNRDGTVTRPTARSYRALPAFALFLLVLLFAAYGPTLSALCGAFGEAAVKALRVWAGYLCILGAFVQLAVTSVYFWHRIEKRFLKQRIRDGWRKAWVRGVIFVVLCAWAVPLGSFGYALLNHDAYDACIAQPQAWPAWVQLGLLAASVALAAVLAHGAGTLPWRIASQLALIVLLVAVLWNLPDIPARTEGAQVPYPHLYAVVAIGLAAIALLATVLVRISFYSLDDSEGQPFREALAERELFTESRQDPAVSWRRILGGGVIGILREPLQFLLLPAFAIILVPTGFIWHACLGGTAASALLITAGNLTSRWDQMSEYLRRYFLTGTPLVVSVSVIVIAALRLANVQYVATVLNVAPFGVLFVWMIMSYALFWWFEYQVNSVLAAKLLTVFGEDGKDDDDVVDYTPGESFVPTGSRVECTHRYLLAHATGQFVIVGWFREKDSGNAVRAFHTYSFPGLFAALLGQEKSDTSDEMGRRIQLYFALVNGALVIGLIALLWHHGRGDRTNTVDPVITAQSGGTVQGSTDLVPLLQAEQNRAPAIVVAASGGGTRAALYTANVLNGLHAIGADRHIVLLSGVSGGGVAAAYFYGHRAALLSGAPQPCDGIDGAPKDPWSCFLERMMQPFIRDVLHGAMEWRVQSQAPLGVLLAESFERRLFADGMKRIGDDEGIGLILNTTISGHPEDDSFMLRGAFRRTPAPPGHACDAAAFPAASLAGGRLAFANIRDTGEFVKRRTEVQSIQLPFVLVQDGTVSLARAAALNANFPPLFPNARVNIIDGSSAPDTCSTRSYYVTDGGATENLGLISALLALQSALSDARLRAPLRDLHIVLAEASAMGYDYSQDRGVGAATGGSKERLTGRLTLELLERVEQAMRAIDPRARVHLHDLSLPRVFRSRGGFGTHWMFPEYIRVMNPQITPLPYAWTQVAEQYTLLERYWVTINKDQFLEIQQALYDPKRPFCARRWAAERDKSKDLSTISDWICGRIGGQPPTLSADGQPEAWAKLIDALK